MIICNALRSMDINLMTLMKTNIFLTFKQKRSDWTMIGPLNECFILINDHPSVQAIFERMWDQKTEEKISSQ